MELRGRRPDPRQLSNEEVDILMLEAQAADFGVVIETDDPERLRTRIRERGKVTGIKYGIKIPANEVGKLYLVKKDAEA